MEEEEKKKIERSVDVWQHLMRIWQTSRDSAVEDAIVQVASAAGVSEIEGVPIRSYIGRRARALAEQMVAEFADTDISLASEIKSLWLQWDQEREQQSGGGS